MTAPTGGAMRLASCAASGGQFFCIRMDVTGAGSNGNIQVLIY